MLHRFKLNENVPLVEWLLSSPPDLAGWVRSHVQTGQLSPTVRSKETVAPWSAD